jgi:hypothetical protein
MIISNKVREYPDNIDMPYVVEYDDIHGMLDSIPRSFLNIKKNYEVLAGQDVMEMVRPPSYEHFRAQMELTLRTDILNLRRDLVRVMSHQMNSQEYLKELSIVALNSIRNYYQIISPKLKKTEEFLEKFHEDFPESKQVLNRVLNYTYSLMKGMDISEEDKLQLILSTINKVLQPILFEVDALGLEFEKTIDKDTKKLSFEDFVKKYNTELARFQDALESEFESTTVKREHVIRGELELKSRQREKNIIDRYEAEIERMKNEYNEKYQKIEETFDGELEKRTTEFINKKLEEQQGKLQNEYETKLKKMRDELEVKYITIDLHEREEKLRKEFNEYERSLRDSFDVREKALREELGIKEKNFRESLDLEFKAKLEIQREKLQRDYENELDDATERNQRKEQRRFETELRRREKALEKTLKSEFSRKEKELNREFKRDLQIRENEVKSKLQLNFEREKLKIESKKSEAFLKLIDK